MPDLILLDNDVVLKTSRYALTSSLLGVLSPYGAAVVLGSARFVLRHRVARGRSIADRAGTAAALEALLNAIPALEPDDGEVALAAELQEGAQSLGLLLDSGESLLLAVLVLRPVVLMATGDKRAVAAAEAVLRSLPYSTAAAGKLACLEQLAAAFLRLLGPEVLRARICADPEADKALSICFSCSSSSFSGENAAGGLSSYVAAIRATAPTLLAPSDDLSPFLA